MIEFSFIYIKLRFSYNLYEKHWKICTFCTKSTIITRGLLNTRLKDFYDVYVLINTKINDLDRSNLIKAIKNIFKRRETNFDLEQFNELINDLSDDNNMNNLWSVYVLKNPYAKNVKFEDTINALKK